MDESYFSGATLDDVMRYAIEAVQSRGVNICPGKGSAVELTGVLLKLTNPRARLSRTETRGKVFSCLGELCWYLSGSKELEFISYYIPIYKEYADDGLIFGGYGPRFFNWKGINQIENITSLLKRRPDSRRAVVQLFDAADLVGDHKDVPCTSTLQFMLRDNRLHLLASMRSNDLFLGFPHDIFSFTMLQEIVARELSAELGTYSHAVGSLHLYDVNSRSAQRFLDEGWQQTDMPMPPMPVGDPWPAINTLLKAESEIRANGEFTAGNMEHLDAYWADLIRLLQILRYRKDRAVDKIRPLIEQISSPTYVSFINRQLSGGRDIQVDAV